MAGIGPPPKDPSKRARQNRDGQPLVVLEHRLAREPRLPAKRPGGDSWPAQTRVWWKMWRDSPISDTFTESDWSELLDTALLHAKLWAGDTKVAPELRLRVAKFGATPTDRLRLRMQFAQADHAEGKSAPPKSEEPYTSLRPLPSPE